MYYDSVMPYLVTVLTNAREKDQRMLRAKAVEAISLVGMAVGKEKFAKDAKQVRSSYPKERPAFILGLMSHLCGKLGCKTAVPLTW